MLPTFAADPRSRWSRRPICEPMRARNSYRISGRRAYAIGQAALRRPRRRRVYVATPHQLHAKARACRRGDGKHVLVEKPIAMTLDECRTMIDAAERAGVRLIVGHSHSFDAPIRRTREIIASGAVGAVRMINAQYFTDFLYRPRRPEELDTARGGGVVFSQAAHQVDVVRLLGGGRVRSVRAQTGAWDARARPKARTRRC